jgi:hypothetical protein
VDTRQRLSRAQADANPAGRNERLGNSLNSVDSA